MIKAKLLSPITIDGVDYPEGAIVELNQETFDLIESMGKAVEA